MTNIPANIYLLGVMTNTKRASFRSDVEKIGRSKLGTKAGLQRAISQFSQEKKAQLSKTETGVKCEECSRGTATCSCSKCETVYCSGCFERVHSYSNALRKHVPMPVVQTSDTAVGCPEHNNRPLEFYDKDEGRPVCSHCVVSGDRQTHMIVPINDIAQEIQAQFRESIEEVSTTVSYLEKSVQKICGAIPEVKAEKNNIVNDIREQFHVLFAALQTRQQSLIKEVELKHDGEMNLEKLREDATQNVRKAKDYIQELETLISQPQTLIDNANKLKSQLETFREMGCCAVTVESGRNEAKFDAGEDLCDIILKYGSVLTDGCERLELKKINEMTEEDLTKFIEDTEHAESDVTEEHVAEAENSNQDGENVQQSETTTVRSITASKILRANLAYRHELVLVTHIRDPCQFMIQRVADLEQLQLMMNVINIYCDSTEKVHDLLYDVKLGDMVCAQFTSDNQWYRACIKTAYSPASPNVLPTLENALCVEVQYIDYGNSEWLPLSRLRKMKSEFLKIPELAQCCSLADIVPPFQEDKWPAKAIRAFGSLTGDKPLLMTVIEKKGSKMIIDLRHPEDDEPTQDDDRPASVRDALVFLEVARFSSPASKPEGLFFPKKTYKEPVPIGEGALADVLVTHIVSPGEIYVQKLQGEETVEFQHIMEEMGKMFSGRRRGSEWSVPWPYKGLLCAGRFTEDKIWYRALVTGVNSDETVDVTYVDFGNSEKLPFSDIRKLPDMFLRLPKQALPISLVDIKPNGNKTDWQKEDQQNVASLLLNRSLIVDVKDISEDKMSVLLYDTSGSQDVCINEFLVMSGYCQSAGLGIVKSQEELVAKQENAEENSVNGQQEQPVETNIQDDNTTESEIQSTGASECSSLTEEDKVVTEEKMTLQKSNDPQVSSTTLKEFQYKPALIPQTRKFPMGITFVDSQGYIYAQEVKEGDRTLINIMATLLERYGKGEDQSSAPCDVASVTPGFPCCAQFSEDGMWYRARVTRIVDQDKVEVNYVDFGNSEVLSLSAIRLEIPFIEVPQQCLQLVLRGIEPKTADGHWPAETINVLSQMIVGQDCVATTRDETLPGYPLVVNLFLPDGLDVAHSLLSRGLVQKSNFAGGEEDSSHSFPRKQRGPRNTKPKRSVTETRAHAQKISSREAGCMLANTELPGDGIRFDVTITHIERPDCLYIQRVPPTDTDKGLSDDPDPTLLSASLELRSLEQLMEKINAPDFFKNYTPLTTATTGMLCCARYSEDDTWYRAQVKSVEHENPLEVRVVYVDYGTTEVVKAERLRGFPSELLELPIQSTRCFLADIKPPETTEGPMMDDGCWPLNAVEALIQIVAGKKLVAKTLFSGPPASVILYEHSTRSNGIVEEVSIGYLLAEQGLAKFSDDENMPIERSNYRDEESSECDDKAMDCNESDLGTTSEASETNTFCLTSPTSNLIDKILAEEMCLATASDSEQKVLIPSEVLTENNDPSLYASYPEDENTEIDCPVFNNQSTSQAEVTEEESHDQHQVASSAHVSSVTSRVTESILTEVNQDSIESSV